MSTSVLDAAAFQQRQRTNELLLESVREGSLAQMSRWSPSQLRSRVGGMGLLHHAASVGRVDMMEWLVDQGQVPVAGVDARGGSALLEAAAAGRLDAMSWLFKRGLCADDTDARGDNALSLAAGCGHLKVLKFIWRQQDAAALVNRPNESGATPLHLAVAYDRLAVCKWLVQHGGDPTTMDRVKGWGAVHTAAGNGRCRILRWLLESHPELVHARSREGFDALQVARLNGFEDCAALAERWSKRLGCGRQVMDPGIADALAEAAAGALLRDLEEEEQAQRQAKENKVLRKREKRARRLRLKQARMLSAVEAAAGQGNRSAPAYPVSPQDRAYLRSPSRSPSPSPSRPSRSLPRSPPPSPIRYSRSPPRSPVSPYSPQSGRSPMRWSNNAANTTSVVEERRVAMQLLQKEAEDPNRDTEMELNRMLKRCVHLDPHARRSARQQFARSSVPSHVKPVEVRKSNDEEEWHIVYTGRQSGTDKAIITFSPVPDRAAGWKEEGGKLLC